MTTHLANNPDFNSNGETDDETTIFSPEDETSDEEISPKTDFKKEFGRSADKKKNPNPTSLEELRNAYNNVGSISEFTRFLWNRVEHHERANGLFKDKG